MSNQEILNHRRQRVADILRAKGLRAALICNPRRENLEHWLLDEGPIPAMPPFGTLNLILVTEDGAAEPFCAEVNHPCDFPHYRLFQPERLSPLIWDNRIGIVGGDFLLHSTSEALAAMYPGLEFIDVSREIYLAKARKTDAELAALRRSAVLYDRVFRTVPLILRQGVTEREAAVELRHRLALSGAGVEFLSEDPMLASVVELESAPQGGDGAPVPAGWPGRRIAYGDQVHIAVRGVMPEGCAAMGRCYVLGQASERRRRLWELALEAQDAAAALLRPGATLRQICREVNERVLLPAGSLPDESCWVHGVGCAPCEAPRCVDAFADVPLEAGMTLAVAPRVRLPGETPNRCMDTFVVTREGGERLFATDRTLREI